MLLDSVRSYSVCAQLSSRIDSRSNKTIENYVHHCVNEEKERRRMDINDIILDESETMKDGDNPKDADYVPGGKTAKRKRVQNRPKISDLWDHDDTVKLINEVETRPCLWSAGHADYKNRTKRESAWKEIALLLNEKFTTDQLNAKWQNLRTQYRHAVASMKKTKSGQANEAQPHWKYHSNMAFVSAAEETQTTQSESNMSIDDDDPIASSSSGVAVRHRKQTSAATAETSKANRDEIILTTMKCAMERLAQPKKPTDDVQIFGNYVVSELRKINDQQYREKTQRKLIQVLHECMDNEPVNTITICYIEHDCNDCVLNTFDYSY